MSYTTLFEVKLMHEYFLTAMDGAMPFALSAAPARHAFLKHAFEQGRDSLDNDIAFRWAPGLAPEAGMLKLLPSYCGFQVAARTRKTVNAGGDIKYRPETPLPATLDLLVLLYAKNASFNSYTNARLLSTLPAVHFFTNDRGSAESAFPFLTGRIPGYDPGRNYEQGELASFGANDTRAFYFKDTSQWQTIGGNFFANEGDRKLMPLQGYYSFAGNTGITVADFELKDKDGNSVWSYQAEDPNGIEKYRLDFTGAKDMISVNPGKPFRDSELILTVNTNTAYTATHTLLFVDGIDWRGLWGAVHFNLSPQDVEFKLFDNEGYLIKRNTANGNSVNAPVFEIPLKSRSAFWRYTNNRDQKLKPDGPLADYVDEADDALVSKEPKAISQSDFKLRKPGTGDTVYVPNPTALELKSDNTGRLYFDIVVPASDLFPTAPT